MVRKHNKRVRMGFVDAMNVGEGAREGEVEGKAGTI
jgi:hypothetical protein